MAYTRRVAVVTGANKGIGFGIVRGLCKQLPNADVYLTARNEDLGQEAVKKLNAEGLQPKFHQLDITDTSSIDRIRAFLQSTYKGLDILVNNAGIAFKPTATEPFAVQAETTVNVNFWGTQNVCTSLFPLLKPHARVVNVSSSLSGMTAEKCSPQLQQRFLASDITGANVEQLMKEFVSACKDGSYFAKGWAEPDHGGLAYGGSKLGVTLMSFVQQKEMDKDPRDDIIVNAMCPGYVSTDLTDYTGILTIDEGADTAVYLSLLPENADSPRGKFLRERTVLSGPGFSLDYGVNTTEGN